ncbi:unnamed protein product [Thelazia callipaeda]|uniref:WD_REPEATS_REGION domain-containing protein n=1 Tax=Thelazia callipaeda TaxID=103827 RepID=A0A0N5CJN6_THECL|nr:unnamed protein product [Thelazia callipaeda]
MAVPSPLFVHFGLDRGVSCSAIVTLNDETYLSVGTTGGNCRLFSLTNHLHVATVYDDLNKRSIVAVGQFSENCIFLHIRAYKILVLSVNENSKVLNFNITKSIRTEYYGFCGAFRDKSNFFCPMYKNDKCKINIYSDISEESSEVEFSDNRCSLMATSVTNNGYLICGFDDGNTRIVDISDLTIKHEKQLYSDSIFSCASFANMFAISSVKPPIMLCKCDGEITVEKEIMYPQKAGGCSSLCFSECGKMLASGYWNGTVRINSVKTGKIRAFLDFHSEIINFLHWNQVNKRRLLFVCSKDAKLSMWNLHND